MLVIVSALPWEADRFVRRLRGRQRDDLADGWVVRGECAAIEVRVVVSGPGPDRARSAAAGMATMDPPPTDVLAIGVAGGLQSGLRAGSLVLADRLLASPEGQPLDPDADLSAWIGKALAEGAIPYRAGANLTVASALTSRHQKQGAAASSEAAVVQMEDHVWAEAAAVAGWPFASLRAVLDPVERSLPEAVTAWDWRGPRAAEVAAATLRHPWLSLSLARLGWERERARRSIDRALETIVTSGEAPERGQTT